MINFPEGNAIIYCEGAFTTPNGKTAHGLVRRTDRYNVISVVDSTNAGTDAGILLNKKPASIPVHRTIRESYDFFKTNSKPTHLVIGIAPDGGRLDSRAREDIKTAIELGLNIDSGLHDFLSDDTEISELASKHGSNNQRCEKDTSQKSASLFLR